jgi:hypothetical protein
VARHLLGHRRVTSRGGIDAICVAPDDRRVAELSLLSLGGFSLTLEGVALPLGSFLGSFSLPLGGIALLISGVIPFPLSCHLLTGRLGLSRDRLSLRGHRLTLGLSLRGHRLTLRLSLRRFSFSLCGHRLTLGLSEASHRFAIKALCLNRLPVTGTGALAIDFAAQADQTAQADNRQKCADHLRIPLDGSE